MPDEEPTGLHPIPVDLHVDPEFFEAVTGIEVNPLQRLLRNDTLLLAGSTDRSHIGLELERLDVVRELVQQVAMTEIRIITEPVQAQELPLLPGRMLHPEPEQDRGKPLERA